MSLTLGNLHDNALTINNQVCQGKQNFKGEAGMDLLLMIKRKAMPWLA
jgi:hypothetical protein